MKIVLENEEYDRKLIPSDWRYSAAIQGLYKYLNQRGLKCHYSDDELLYNSDDITEKEILEFIEYNYNEDMHHVYIENILRKTEFTEDDISFVNEKLSNKGGSSNTIMKNVFKGIKFDGTNKQDIIKIIDENRETLIKETFRNKKNLYSNFANVNQLFNDDQDYCRLVGYCIDAPKKGKSIGYNFEAKSYVGNDIKEMDFIPFAFSGGREKFFINNNYSIKSIIGTNNILEKEINSIKNTEDENIKGWKTSTRGVLFKLIQKSSDFIDYDVEVIVKNQDNDYFETMYIRKDSIEILRELESKHINYNSICFRYKVNDKLYIDFEKEVTDRILNKLVLDDLIELILKDRDSREKSTTNHSWKLKNMISINILIRGEENMEKKTKQAFACAKKVVERFVRDKSENKISTYSQKLTSAIVFKDYDRFCEIMLQLSNYTGIEFGFIYDLFEDFEGHKDLAYTFISALSKESDKVEE